MNPLARLPRPAVVAHRGASAYAPENTLAAFRLAHSQGADAIEFDIRLSADGHIVVFHDDTLNRTTNGRGRVRDLPLADLRQLDAGGWCDAAFAAERIPTLTETLTAVGQDMILNIELKETPARLAALARAAVEQVRAAGLLEQVIFSGFDERALQAIHQQEPRATLGRLAAPGLLGAWARLGRASRLPVLALHPYYRDVTPALLERVHNAGRRLLTYTVNRPEDMLRLYALGVDGIFTDDPALAFRLRPGGAL